MLERPLSCRPAIGAYTCPGSVLVLQAANVCRAPRRAAAPIRGFVLCRPAQVSVREVLSVRDVMLAAGPEDFLQPVNFREQMDAQMTSNMDEDGEARRAAAAAACV